MTKRADKKFKRRKNDAYDTPKESVLPLLPHIQDIKIFDEPCAGSGQLIDALCDHGKRIGCALDILPRRKLIAKGDALSLNACYGSAFITNPPWTRSKASGYLMHRIITHLSDIAPTWLLFDADWMHTKQAIPFKGRCSDVVSVGRVSWLANGVSGFDNCAWYRFDHLNTEPTRFHWRLK